MWSDLIKTKKWKLQFTCFLIEYSFIQTSFSFMDAFFIAFSGGSPWRFTQTVLTHITTCTLFSAHSMSSAILSWFDSVPIIPLTAFIFDSSLPHWILSTGRLLLMCNQGLSGGSCDFQDVTESLCAHLYVEHRMTCYRLIRTQQVRDITLQEMEINFVQVHGSSSINLF